MDSQEGPITRDLRRREEPGGAYRARIAVYGAPGEAPAVVVVERPSLPALLAVLTSETMALLERLTGTVPLEAVREVIENLVHAGCEDAVVTILEQGRVVRISDRGPGVPEKERALLPGYTTAGPDEREVVRGVGSGLTIALESVSLAGGSLDIEDNLSGGTVVTLRVPPAPARAEEALAGGTVPESLADRQLKVLLLVVELGPVGPTRLAHELNVATSTAFRDLQGLQARGYVRPDEKGYRSATEQGLLYLQAVL